MLRRQAESGRQPGDDLLAHRVGAREGVAQYLASPRRLPFNEHGLFRHYDELDAPA